MYARNYPTHLIRIIQSYISRRSFRIKINDTLSTPRIITAGVPQGSALSPHLYTIYTADIPSPPNTIIATYADDTAILTQSIRPDTAIKLLQTAIDSILTWCHIWRITINAEKSQAVLFKRHSKKSHTGHTYINHDRINWKPSAKYLGVQLDKRLRYNTHITQAVKKAKAARGVLWPLMGKASKLAANSKLLLYKQVLRPILTYAAPIWVIATPTNLDLLQRYQNIALRMVLQAPWYTTNTKNHEATNIPTIETYIKELTKSFYDKIEIHPNQMLQQNLTYDPELFPRHKRPRLAITQ